MQYYMYNQSVAVYRGMLQHEFIQMYLPFKVLVYFLAYVLIYLINTCKMYLQ